MCLKCSQGRLCDMPGLTEPKQASGFYVLEVDHKYSVYKCRDRQECPSGVVGTCAKGRTGISCGNCLPNHRVADSGECEECKGLHNFLFVAVCLVALCFLFFFYIYATSDPSRQSNTLITVALTMGQLVFVVQALSVFRDIAIDWAEPIRSLLSFLEIFTFKLDIVSAQCLYKKDEPVMNLLFALLLFPIFMVMLGCVTFLVSLVGMRERNLKNYTNTVGFSGLIVYIPITVTVLRALHCTKNPNGTSSIASNPSIVCWDSLEHASLVVLSIIGLLLFPVAFLACILRSLRLYSYLVLCGPCGT